ncbi:MAG: FAD-dependent oxidoreductase, partial [Sphingomicrobium sp.]
MIEIACPILLALGLATRLAAIPLLVLSLVIQFEYKLLNEHVYWAVLFGWYAIMGAGPLSLDRMLSAGFADSALPFARALSGGVAVFRRWVGPLYQLALRAWLAVILAAPSLAGLSAVDWFGFRYPVALLLPGSPAYLGVVLGIICPLMLVSGLAVRLIATVAALTLFSQTGSPNLSELVRFDYLYWILLLSILVFQGAGMLSLDHALWLRLRRRFPQWEGKPAAPLDQLPQVIIVGAGFGGLSAARGLRHAPCRVTLVDAHNYHLFQPLLYQVATASLSPADVAAPIRGSFRDQFNARVLLGKVTAVDRQTQAVVLADGRRLSYDYLVLATGARHAYFGREEWEGLAPGLKQIDDATRIRRRLLVAFEEAENAADPRSQQQWLTFVIVGGGPTGVELAGAIAELARHGMEREFRNIDPAAARVVLVQSAPRILPTFPEPLSAFAEQTLKKLGVETLTNNRVQDVDDTGVIVSGRRLEARTVFWAAGVMASPAAQWLAAEADS